MLSGAALNALELCLCAGLGLMAWSWLARRRRNFLAGVPETHIAELRPGVTTAVTGVAEAPELLVSPVSKTPCVFYEAQVYVQESRPPYFDDGTFPDSGDPTMGPKLVWVRGSREQVGGFYVRNGAF
jgi:hypothetical protein